MQLTGFEGRVALVTGAAGGIGEALVRLLAEAGCTVLATDREVPAVAGPRVQALALDVTDSAAVDALVDRVEADIGPIQLAASVAGVLHVGAVAATSDADWRRVFAVNADGAFHVGRALARVMSPRGAGAIVTVSSNAAGVPRHGMAAYAASKAAATMFTRCLGLELAPLGIRVNGVAPGTILTDFNRASLDSADKIQAVADRLPLGRVGNPQDVVGAVLYLCSPLSDYVTGQLLVVDGGRLCRSG